MTATLMGRFARRLTVAVAAAAWVASTVALWQTSVPALDLGGLDQRAYFTPELLERAASYSAGQRLLWLAGTLASLAALVVLVRRLPRSVPGMGLGRISSAVVAGMVILATLWLVGLPFRVASLWWQHRYGLGPFDVAAWLLSERWALAADAVFAMVAIAVVVGLAARFPRRWWIPAAALFGALATLLVLVSGWLSGAGTEPLASPGLRDDVARLERIQGVSVPVRVTEVSDWTSQANAFATGFGPSAHVVLWDTLLDGRFSRGEVGVVVSHEFAHVARHHVLKGVAWYALFAFPLALAVAGVTRRRGGLGRPENLPLAVLTLTVAGLLLAPFQNAVSRRYEAEADWQALTATRDPNAAERLFQGFARTGLQEPDPPLWDYVWLETHPTIMQRLAMVERFRAR